MTQKKFPPLLSRMPHLLHGGDYNPDQWQNYPEILEEDIRLMRQAGINSATLGVFSWSMLEPREGEYHFEWLDEAIDRLHRNGISVVLATPSGARPAWMDKAHPECLRVNADRTHNLHGYRHDHCYTAPYYREKVRQMDTLLAERYGHHPAVALWHVSNEYNGECHCELCQQAFRDWLRERYGNDIDRLNHAWWTAFWSNRFGSFDEIESPSPLGQQYVHGLVLDWKRFVTHQTVDFLKQEIAALKAVTPDLPVTTNLMGTFEGLDYQKLADAVDIVSWDSYPAWHNDYEPVWYTAADTAFSHDLMRGFKHRPFLLMESTPSCVNWAAVNKLKRPGIHALSSLQAVAHGADSVQYFQWRKGRGAFEKFHGAVVDHVGTADTRVFREVEALGKRIPKLDGVCGTMPTPPAAVLYDWENRWAIEASRMTSEARDYTKTCQQQYRALWKRGIAADVINMEHDLSPYRLVVAPMLYMLKPGVAERLRAFVEAGGILVTTYLTGYVNETDLCFLGGFPGDGLREVIGVWAEELDALYPADRGKVVFPDGREFATHTLCEVLRPAPDTEILATYGDDYYAGTAAVTRHRFGKGVCYHIAAHTDGELPDAVYEILLREHPLPRALETVLPEGVTAGTRSGDGETWLFLQNFTDRAQTVVLPESGYVDAESGKSIGDSIDLESYECRILKA